MDPVGSLTADSLQLTTYSRDLQAQAYRLNYFIMLCMETFYRSRCRNKTPPSIMQMQAKEKNQKGISPCKSSNSHTGFWFFFFLFLCLSIMHISRGHSRV
ncbi:uncharacterized protein BO80DRAFT_189753 [Aspergillus ibericus CBS 121593]|uniref:Uncharacterized protein n=1 Tax=Aspergillus ibericus CBS 121593 TaxID=1448316 RepID=A0A395GTP7_9EURO|nr:hypothetical protein BO80DRAFT_189753 [Aspergillus ibericus CBS 121593]RAK97473.1 hypothetical protein BO80DRAFT_189753 [Aspergillus ibericus CBS 121593]